MDHGLITGVLIFFVFISVLCANVANVYSASVGWELVAPKALIGRKEYLILGLSLTTVFILVFDLFPLESALDTSDSSLVNLCIVLLLGHVISVYRKKSAALFEKTTYFIDWLIATCQGLVQLVKPQLFSDSSLSINFFLIVGVVVLSFMGRRVISYWKRCVVRS